jgi:4-hydroxybenzoate polyprenyltransferase
MTRYIGASLGFLAFAVATVLGVAVGNPMELIVQRAILAMLVFFGIGAALGWTAGCVIDEHMERRRQAVDEEMKRGDEPERAAKAPPRERLRPEGKEEPVTSAPAGAG